MSSFFFLGSFYSRRVVPHVSAKNKISWSSHKLKEQNSALHLAVVNRCKGCVCVCVSVHIHMHIYAHICEKIYMLEMILLGIILYFLKISSA